MFLHFTVCLTIPLENIYPQLIWTPYKLIITTNKVRYAYGYQFSRYLKILQLEAPDVTATSKTAALSQSILNQLMWIINLRFRRNWTTEH